MVGVGTRWRTLVFVLDSAVQVKKSIAHMVSSCSRERLERVSDIAVRKRDRGVETAIYPFFATGVELANPRGSPSSPWQGQG